MATFDLPSTSFTVFEEDLTTTSSPSFAYTSSPESVTSTTAESYGTDAPILDLQGLSNKANEAERDVVDMLEKKIKAEKVFSASEREHIIDSTNASKKAIMEADRELLMTARDDLEKAKVKASKARQAYSERVAAE